MEIIETIPQMVDWTRQASRSLGLVPTMGALHEGHLSLVEKARSENASLVVTIFVNPTQFSKSEDLGSYPRDIESDLEVLRNAQVDAVFVPKATEIYPHGYDTWVDVGALASKLEGEWRSEHFRGVATVVTKLFGIIRPDVGYFGQKDGQQSVVLKQIVRDLNLGVELVICPTIRDENGLALSSRNSYLTAGQQVEAGVIFRSLSAGQETWESGETRAESIRTSVKQVLRESELITSIDYISVADSVTLDEVDVVSSESMLSVAVRIGSIRLIDNVILAQSR
jgi:pantoate--beta-alanine ligase